MFLSDPLSQTGGNVLGRDIYAQFNDGKRVLLASPEPVGYRTSAWKQPVFDVLFGLSGRIVGFVVRLFVKGLADESPALGGVYDYAVDLPDLAPTYGPFKP